jgi:aryl-alcohol dehydrogenase-like predicted oxidoreductase
MQTVTLGATRLEVTPLAYGTWQFGGDWGPVDEPAAIAAIQGAWSAGINFFDTAQAYGFGLAERILGAALAADLRGARHSVVIATKGGLRMDGDTLVRDSSRAGCARAPRPAWTRWAPTTSTCTRCTGPTRPRPSPRPRPRWPT